jgi:hypothetical protein
MEKISNIVRGSSRVASTDLKSSAPLRPGTPSFGRAVAESQVAQREQHQALAAERGTTASRAVALHNEMEQKRNGGKDAVVAQMADSFFMTRIRRPEPEEDSAIPGATASEREGDLSAEAIDEGVKQPSGFKPRGTYVNVQA